MLPKRAFIILIILIVFGLTGCNTAAEMMIDPGKYLLYNCADLTAVAKSETKREQKLRRLMNKSAKGPGGEFVNLIAYRAEYLQAQGYQKLAYRMFNEKKCARQ